MPDAIYYDPEHTDLGLYFRTGQAWLVVPDPHSSCDENFGELDIPVHAYHALVYLGAIDQLARLPHLFILGAWEEGVILPPGLQEAAEILERFSETLESHELDALIMTRMGDDPASSGSTSTQSRCACHFVTWPTSSARAPPSDTAFSSGCDPGSAGVSPVPGGCRGRTSVAVGSV